MNNRQNINLWINNDEGLYHLALNCIRRAKQTMYYRHGYKPRWCAAKLMLEELQAFGLYKTPDGTFYTHTSIMHAMVGM